MKILYCSYSQIPSNFANSSAVMQQCAALNAKADLLALLIHGEPYADVFQHYRVAPFPLILLPKYSLKWNELGLKLALLRYTWRWKPDVVYSRDVILNNWLCKFHVPNVYEIHQLDQDERRFDRYYKNQLRSITDSRYLKGIVCISDALRKECMDFGIPEEKLTVLHSGVSVEYEDSAVADVSMPRFEADKPIAMYVGSLQKGKGIETILKMADISGQYNFLIIGGASGAIQVKKNLKHIPQVSNERARQYMRYADFLLLPMTKQKYKFHSPLKMFEYLSAGKVIIASQNTDLMEILQHGENAMIAQEDNPRDFLSQMDRVCGDPSLRERLCHRAFQTARSHTWDIRAEAICNLLKEKIS